MRPSLAEGGGGSGIGLLASSLAICTCQVPSPEQLLAACSVCSCVGAPPIAVPILYSY